ncbi:MAG: T9SS type A sorting domain-containing protein [Saprospiraceae bacterium]|nr:T9SS type A sorting domain-containing protein [Saprospiraceae bacterium]
MNKLFFSLTYCNFAHYNQLQTATSKLQSIISPLTSTCHDGVLVPLSGRLKQLLQSATFKPLLLLRILAILILSTLFTASNSRLLAQTDTFVCDNGGFEDDFDFYFGETSSYLTGSDECEPKTTGGVPVTWTSSSLPAFRRFEIVSGGTDPLVQIPRTKFGSKSLLINNRYGHTGDVCQGHFDANRIKKRFKVTEENRIFSIWFAAVLENPSGHTNSQPFFSIMCDLAPYSDLCIDASIINCHAERTDSICDFDPIDSIDWACHKIIIPSDQIGNIATLEIMAADCGQGCHFGYAYIDGICEDCDDSAFGSGTLYDSPLNYEGIGIMYSSCEDDTITICGDYILPPICGEWLLDTVIVPNFTIYNLTIDHETQTFCFQVAADDFSVDDCREIFALLYFKANNKFLPAVSTNMIEVCLEDFNEMVVNRTISACYDNETDDYISDDYYYVTLQIGYSYFRNWTLTRILDEPYPNETGIYSLENGIGDETIILGPFLIQEGSWDLIVQIGTCEYEFLITPPDFCGLCTAFNKLKIFDILCDNNSSSTGSDDTWSFQLNVPRLMYFGDYELYKNASYVDLYSYNNDHQIDGGLITGGCIKIKLIDDFDEECEVEFIVCPPKPCSSDNSECNLEAYVKKYYCEDGEFSIDLEVKNSGSGSLCYRSNSVASPNDPFNVNNQMGSLPSGTLGAFDEDIYLTVYLCSSPTCFKRFYIPYLNCDEDNFQGEGSSRSYNRNKKQDLFIAPNPIKNNEINIFSMLDFTIFEIFNIYHQTIYKGNFKGSFLNVNLELKPGVYILQYTDRYGIKDAIKFVKP